MRLIRLKEVILVTGLARSTIYKYIAEKSFPKPVSLGERCVGWVDDEVQDWIVARVEERNVAQGTVVAKPDRLSLACQRPRVRHDPLIVGHGVSS